MIKIGINGMGNMGQTLKTTLEKSPDIQAVCCLDKSDDLAQAIRTHQPEIIVDFTHPTGIRERITQCLTLGCHIIVGTTGLKPDDGPLFLNLARETGKNLVICPNFSIGAVMIIQAAATMASHMPAVEIIERHHIYKADAPSGTALQAADRIATANAMINTSIPESQAIVEHTRGGNYGPIPIHAMRLPGHLAQLDICFGNTGERVTLSHDTLDRTAFMPGVLLCIRKIAGLPVPVTYGLESLL